MTKFIVSFFLVIVALAACARPPVLATRPEDSLKPLTWWQTVTPRDDREFRDIAPAVRQSLEYYKRLPQDTVFFLGSEKTSALEMAATLQQFLLIIENDSLSPDQKVKRIKKEFLFYRSVGANKNVKVLFTG